MEAIRIEKTAPENLICRSHQVLGNGIVEDIQDIVFVDRKRFNRKHTQAVANEISHMNSQLLDEHRPYLLIGMGRWGSMDPWLGIPVRWNQIAGARAIIETSFEDLHVDPSQGSHFLENLNSFSVGYFTVIPNKDSFIDWEWLESQKAEKEGSYTKLLHFKNPLIVKINGKANLGIIQKPKR